MQALNSLLFRPVPHKMRNGILTHLSLVCALPLLVTLSTPSITLGNQANWPQWRGPLGNGVAPEGNPPTRWSETQNVQWKVKVPGFGSGTPIVWGDQVFLLTALAKYASPDAQRKDHQFVVLSIERNSGKTLWQQTARELIPHEGHHRDHGFASASALTDGEHLLAYFGSRGLYCYDLTGNLKWSRDFGDMRTRNGFGEGSTPALHGDTVVVNWDHEGPDFVVALNKDTGEEIWRQSRDEPTSWATPLIVEHDGKAQVVVNGTKAVRSYDLKTGTLIWECGGQTVNVIPSPVTGHGMVYAMSGFRGAALKAIQLGHTGDLTDAPGLAWSHDRNTPYVPSPLLYGQLLYFHKGNNAMLSCVDAKTGKAYFEEKRLDGPNGIYASPVGAAGRVYVVGRDGTSLVLRNDGKGQVLAMNKLEDRIDASPAIVGGQLFLRGHEHLYCIAE